MNSKQCIQIACVLSLATVATVGYADVDTEGNREDVYILPAFEITKDGDSGYRSSNVISATKFNSQLIDASMNVQILNEDFLRDISSVHLVDAMSQSAAVNVRGNGVVQDFDNFRPQIRGFTTQYQLRNGVRTYANPPSAVVERVEVIKGPASTLYGLLPPGGMVNLVTKRARVGSNGGYVEGMYGSYDSYRGTVDYNTTVLEDRLAFRIVGLKSEYADDRENSDTENDALLLSASYRFGAKTTLTASWETTYQNRVMNFNLANVKNSFMTSGNSDLENGSIPFWIAYPQFGFTHRDSLADPRNEFEFKENGLEAQLEHKFTDRLSAQLTYSTQDHENIQTTGFSNGGWWDGGSAGIGRDESGVPNSLGFDWANVYFNNTISNATLNVLYSFEIGETEHIAMIGRNEFWETFDMNRFVEPTGGNPWNPVIYRLDNLGPNMSLDLPPESSLNLDGTWGWARWEDNDWHSTQASIMSKWFNRRLITTVGLLDTKIRSQAFQYDTGADGFDPISNPIGRQVQDQIDTGTVPMFGANYAINDSLRLFALYSESLDPNTGERDGFGEAFRPKEAEGNEIGLKWLSRDGVWSGSFSIYDIEMTNQAQGSRIADNLDARRYRELTPEQRAVEFPGKTEADLRWDGNRKIPVSQRGRGFDLDVYYTPSENLQMVLSYAKTDVETTGSVDPSLNGRKAGNSIDHRVVLTGKYKFTEGALKGLDLGANLRWQDKRYRGSVPLSSEPFRVTFEDGSFTDLALPGDDVLERFSSPDLTNLSMWAQYNFKVGEGSYWTKLYIGNLLPSENKVYLGDVPTTASHGYPTMRYSYELPTSFQWSVGRSF